MFGLFRLYLAMAVVAFHLLRVPAIGWEAVFTFFTLSGFLMTLIIQRTYGYGPRGFAAFFINRFLRLYPSYWVAIGCSLIVLAITTEPFARQIAYSIGFPRGAAGWLMNLTMIFPALSPSRIDYRLLLLVWTLTVELFYYVVIALGGTRTKAAAWLLAGSGLAYHAFGVATGQDFDFHYHSIAAGALPFGAGGLAFHYREELRRRLGDNGTLGLTIHGAILATFGVATFVVISIFHLDPTRSSAGKLLSLVSLAATVAVSTCVIPVLWRPGRFVISKALDDYLGKFSYPTYLLHVQCGVFVAYAMFGHPVGGANVDGLVAFAATTALTLAIGWLIVTFLEPAIDRLRDRVKLHQARPNAHSSSADALAAGAAAVRG